MLELGHSLPPKVVKPERPGSGAVAKEQRLLPFLRGHGLGVPVIEHSATAEAAPAPVATPAGYVVMAFVPSRPLPAIHAQHSQTARHAVARLGDAVARLLAVPLDAAPLGWSVAQSHAARLEWGARRHATLSGHPARSARYERAFALAGALLPSLLDGYEWRAGRPLTAAERQEQRVWGAYDPLLGAMFRHELGHPEKAQRPQRRDVVRYEDADGGFAADLTLDPDGYVLHYPGLARRLGGGER